jgi:hypothetical protein
MERPFTQYIQCWSREWTGPKKKGHASTCPGRTTALGRGSHGQQQDMEGWRGNLVHSILCQQHFLVVCETNREVCVFCAGPEKKKEERRGRDRIWMMMDAALRLGDPVTWPDLIWISFIWPCDADMQWPTPPSDLRTPPRNQHTSAHCMPSR